MAEKKTLRTEKDKNDVGQRTDDKGTVATTKIATNVGSHDSRQKIGDVDSAVHQCARMSGKPNSHLSHLSQPH